MSYNQYSQNSYNQPGGYGQQNPFGQSANPHGQPAGGNQYGQPQQQSYGHTGNYSERPDLEHHSSSRYDEESAQPGAYEMSTMNSSDPNRLLNEIRNFDRAISEVEAEMEKLKLARKAASQNPSPVRQAELNKTGDVIIAQLRVFVRRAQKLRDDPDAKNPRNVPQREKVERRVMAALNTYHQNGSEYRKANIDDFGRQYRYVRPDASEAEVREAAETGAGQPVFSQSLLASNRRADVAAAANSVESRHLDIQNIEREIIDIVQLFQDMEALVVQQEPAVAQIEEKGQEAAGHVAQANTELDTAVKSARAARKKKWMCLGIAVLIVIIIVVVVVVVVEVTKH